MTFEEERKWIDHIIFRANKHLAHAGLKECGGAELYVAVIERLCDALDMAHTTEITIPAGSLNTEVLSPEIGEAKVLDSHPLYWERNLP